MKKKSLFSAGCIFLIAAYCAFSFTYNKRWEKNPIVWDAISYYAYLPATFIYHDVSLKFTERDPAYFGMKFWPETAPNGGKVIKTSMGVSYLFAPFFFMGHLYAGVSGAPQDGFSLPYQVFLRIGTIFYLLLGLFFLRSVLLKYFKDGAVAVTLALVFWGTNLLNYTMAEPLVAHVYVFSAACIFVWAADKWHSNPTYGISFLTGSIGGILTVIRPTMILFVLFPLLFGITGPGSWKEKLALLKNNRWKILLLILAFILPGIPQVLYWKYITGDWLFFSYTGERFFWDNPHILKGLFGYRNGWLLYTPVMIFSLIGIFLLKGKAKAMKFPILAMLAIFIYVTHCWWCWWYGGFGLRAYIDIYAVLAISLAAFCDFIFTKKIVVRMAALTVAGLLTALNLFQQWQYEYGAGIHFNAMNKKSYDLGFLNTEVTGEWWLSLISPNYERAKRGMPEYYEDESSLHFIRQIADFDALDTEDSIHCSSTHAYSGRYSYILDKESGFSPPVNLDAQDLVHTDAKGAQVSLKVYFEKLPQPDDENYIVVTFACDTGVYFYKGVNLNKYVQCANRWNSITARMNLENIRSENDKINVYIWSKKTGTRFYVDDLAVESIYPKGDPLLSLFITYFPQDKLGWLIAGFIALLAGLLCFFALNKERVSVGLVVLGGMLIRIFVSLLDPFLRLWDEQFHALIAKNMLSNSFFPSMYPEHAIPILHGNWSTDQIWLHKPPLYLWQIALSFKLFGINEFTLRLPSILMSTLTIWFIYRIGKITVNKTTGFIGALLFAAAYFPVEMVCGMNATDHADAAFAFYITASLWALVEYFRSGKKYWIWLIGALAGMAVLVKLLVGLLVFPVWGILILSDAQRRKSLVSYGHLFLSFLVSLLVAVPWNAFILLKYPAESIFDYADNARRMFEAVEGHGGEWWYYFNALYEHFGKGALVPYLVGVGFMVLLVRTAKTWRILFFSVVAIIYTLFSFAATKMICYTAPAFPILFLGLGCLAETILTFIKNPGREKIARVLTISALFISCLLILDIDSVQENHTFWKLKDRPWNWRDIKLIHRDIYRGLPAVLGEGKWAIFGCTHDYDFPMAMFYSGYIVYDFFPSQDDYMYAKQKGWNIAVFADDELPEYLKNDTTVKKLYRTLDEHFYGKCLN